MRPDWRVSATAAVLAWAAAAAVVLGSPAVLTAPSGLLLVSLPGLVWLRASRRSSLAALERCVAVTALDFGVLVVTAFVLNVAPGGLHATSWAVALASVISLGALIDLGRRRESPEDDGRAVTQSRLRSPRPTLRQGIAIGLGLTCLAAAGIVSVVSAHTSQDEHFTELSLTPCPPTRQPTSAVLLVANHERSTTHYRVSLVAGVKKTNHVITLGVGASYRRVVPLSGGAASVTLYRGSRPYRHVWIGDPQGSPRHGSARSRQPNPPTTSNSTC